MRIFTASEKKMTRNLRRFCDKRAASHWEQVHLVLTRAWPERGSAIEQEEWHSVFFVFFAVFDADKIGELDGVRCVHPY